MTFRVGQKVVCVDASDANCLDQGAIYTVLSVDDVYLDVDCRPSFTGDRGYFHRRFRPIVERKTDISILKALLVPGAKIREDA